jgi:hypothetical protein
MKNSFKITFSIYFFLLIVNSFSQDYRNIGFAKPMNLPFNLAGSFGEPRKDHFHSGIDIKTNGIEGEPVFTIGDGYISRIKVSPYGYGKAIYITHNNGYTSVYAHLSKFFGAIEKYIQQQHYLQKKSEFDIYLDATKFPVLKSDTIAFSGNTGGSSAPHLHFEIRDTKTEHALNPLDFYPKEFYIDTIPPQLNKVKINTIYSNSIYTSNSSIYNLFKVNNEFINKDSIVIKNDSIISFSLEGFDKQDDSENKNGIKKIEVFQIDSLIFKYDLTEIDFDKTRMCNAFVDYNEMMTNNGYFYNCSQLKDNTLDFYLKKNIFAKIKNGENVFNIFCSDYNNNKTKIRLSIVKNETDEITVDTAMSFSSSVSEDIIYQHTDSLSYKAFKIKFNNNTFYDNIYINVTQKQDNIFDVTNINSQQLTPLQKPASIQFKSSIKKYRNKVVIVRQDFKGKETALKTTFDKTKFYAETKELGTFYLKYDTTKPEIKILNLKSEIININISDELSGIDSYNVYIDNKWVNFYYDAKNDVLEYHYDKILTTGKHNLKIIVTDNVGNKNMLTQNFTY